MRRIVAIAAAALLACTPSLDTGVDPSVSPTISTTSLDRVVVAVKGDWGAGTRAQREVTQRMCIEHRETPFAAVLTTGDNFYEPDGTAVASNYYEPERCLLDAKIPWRATWGNHDAGHASTRTVLGAPRWYSWTAGGVRFVALDSNDTSDRAQRTFLERELRAATELVSVVYFHHPPVTVGGHRDHRGVRRHWMPLFERYGVDLVLAGHNHDYEHMVARGVHYVITGGGGRYLTPCLRDRPELVTCTSRHHFVILTIEGRRVHVRAVARSGDTVDEFSFDAR